MFKPLCRRQIIMGLNVTVHGSEQLQVRNKAEEYGAIPDMVEALYREMIARFILIEIEEFQKNEKN